MKKKLTKRNIGAARPAEKDVFVWDTDLTGFLLKVTPTGLKIFLYQYRNTRGLRRYTIGPMGQWTPNQARTEAGRLAGLVAKGEDPQQDKANRRKAGTIDDMLDQFLEEHAKVKTKPATYAEYRRLLDRHVRPAVGKLKAEDLGYDDVEKLHVKMQDTPRQGNLVIAILSKACGWAGRNKHRKGLPNPVHGIERYKELSRTVSLSDADIAALGKALKAKEDGGETPQVFVDAARMVMLSQLRLSEVLSLRPEHIDTENSQLNVGIVKQRERVYPVGAPVLAYLAQFPRDKKSEWLFPSTKYPKKHLSRSALQQFWAEIRKEAGLPHVRLHDLRHVSGSFARSVGASALLVKDFLAHSSVTMSQRYVYGEQTSKR